VTFAYLDCGVGISGDMFLGALLGAGLSVDVLRERLGALGLPGYSIEVSEGAGLDRCVEPGVPDQRADRPPVA
jgi:uncharacterized protein (DUF111 family)